MTENVHPDRMCFDKSDRELYNRLDSEAMLSHKRNSRKEQFLFAMAIGVKFGRRLPLDNREGMFLAKDLHPVDIALLNAVAVFDKKSDEVLADTRKVFQIAEEYAHAGIILLSEKVVSSSYGTFEKLIEKDIMDVFNKIGFVER